MKTEALGKFLIYMLLILIIVEPPVVLLASQEYKEDVPHLSINMSQFLPLHEEHPHVELHHGAHTHEESRIPSLMRTTYTTISGTAGNKVNFTVDGIIVDPRGTVTM